MACCGPNIKRGDENLLRQLRIEGIDNNEDGTPLEEISINLNPKDPLRLDFVPKDGDWKCKY